MKQLARVTAQTDIQELAATKKLTVAYRFVASVSAKNQHWHTTTVFTSHKLHMTVVKMRRQKIRKKHTKWVNSWIPQQQAQEVFLFFNRFSSRALISSCSLVKRFSPRQLQLHQGREVPMVQDTSQQQGPQTLTDGPIILQLTQENSRSQPGQRPQGNWFCQIRRYNRFKPTNSDLSVYIPASISVQQIPGHILVH